MEIGLKILNARIKKGLSRAELRKLSGVSESAIKQYENGSRQPQIVQLQLLANALEIPIHSLIGVDENTFHNTIAINKFFKELKESEEAHDLLNKLLKEEPIKPLDNIDSGDELMLYFHNLNYAGKEEATKRVEELTLIPKYIEDPHND